MPNVPNVPISYLIFLCHFSAFLSYLVPILNSSLCLVHDGLPEVEMIYDLGRGRVWFGVGGFGPAWEGFGWRGRVWGGMGGFGVVWEGFWGHRSV